MRQILGVGSLSRRLVGFFFVQAKGLRIIQEDGIDNKVWLLILQMNLNYHLLFKFIIVGDASVGKSSLLLRFIEDKFTGNYETTLGVQFGSKVLSIGNTVVKTMIWDTAGQESFKSIIRSYYKNAILAFLVFDISNLESFENIQKWLEEVKNNGNEHTRVVLVGNKSDLADSRAVRKEQIQEYCSSLGMAYYQTSAKNGQGVREMFIQPARQLIDDIQSKKLLVSGVNESFGIKIGNPELQAKDKTSIQISMAPRPKERCSC